ncbi:ATP-binding protein [Arcobacter arenosus]|uniref:ATP-binding protein n=1 Tax=Arcobacter arenosus TaxID=2576037 RepID=UPI003BA9C5AA
MNLKTFIKLFSFILVSVLIYMITDFYIQKEQDNKLLQKYYTSSEYIKKNLLTLISDKKNATLSIALSFIDNKEIINSILTKNKLNLDLNKYSLELRKYTKFKNVWFQILDKEGNSFYRSWSDHKSDSLKFRPDVKKILKTKKIQTSISVGRYDMSFKSMVPILKDNELIGIFEVITHFNSISKMLEKQKIDSLILADKKYKNKIKYPFTKKFMGDYYIANFNAKEYLIDLVKKESIEKILEIKDYKIINENYLVTQQVIEFENEIIGYIILTKNLKDIDVSSIVDAKKSSIKNLILFIILIGVIFLAINYYLYLRQIQIEKKRVQTILDSQKNIIVITNGIKIQNANAQLIEFFDEFKSLDEFKEKYDCICERFIEMNDDNYLIDKDYDGRNWAEHILSNNDKKFKAAIKKADKIYHFTLNVNLTDIKEDIPYIIVTLTDITNEIENNKILIKKDRILFQQNKMASMGEMLNNIAHQWRQPLSSISSLASGLRIKGELKLVEENDINYTCEKILNNTNYISQTIEDFRNFFKEKKDQEEFGLKKSIDESLNLLKDRLIALSITTVIKIDEKIKLYSFKSEFQQALLNIINNSIDAFIKNNSKEKIIFITFNKDTLRIKDTAGGVDEKIIEKIFEPYFTTKHQSQGTGIGLYMTQEILVKHMNCKLSISNKNFTYKDKKLKGLAFDISFDLKTLKTS